MFKRIAVFLIACVLCCSTASAETLSQFMFQVARSWSVVDGETSLMPVVTATRTGSNEYKFDVKVTERGGTAGTIDKILIHVFDNGFSSEDVVYESGITGQAIGGNESINLSEVLEVEQGCWVGYEFVVGEKNFMGLVQCGEYREEESQEDVEDEITIQEDR